MPLISNPPPSKPTTGRLVLFAAGLLLCFLLVLMRSEVGAQTPSACDDHCSALDSTATQLTPGAPIAGNLGTAEDVDVFTFAVTGSSQDIWLYTTGDTDTIGLLFKSDGHITDPTTSIAASDDGIIVAGFNFHIGVNLEPGTYYVVVVGAKDTAGNADTGNYSIHWLNLSALPALSLGTTDTGNIETEGEVEVFKFSFTGDAQDVWLYSTGSTDTVGILYHSSDITTASSAWLAAGEDSVLATGRNFYIGLNLEPATYYLAVIGATDEEGNGATGPYRLESKAETDEAAEAPQEPGDPKPPNITPDIASDGIVSPGSDVDLFKLVLGAETDIVVYTTGEVDTIGTLLDADGDEIDGNDDTEFSEGDFNFFFPRTLEPGVYYIEVTGYVGRFGESTGPYKLHVDRVTDQSDSRGGAERVNPGSSAMGFISGGKDEDYFFVSLARVGQVRVYTVGPTDTVGKLENSSGTTLESNDDGRLSPGHNSFLIERNLAAGNYYISVTGWEDETGPYRLVVEPVTDPGASTEGAEDLELGVGQIGSIGVADIDLFKLVLDEPTEIVLYTSGDTDIRGTLLRSDGSTEVDNDDDGGEGFNFLIKAALAAGTYYVRVEGYDNNVAGSYVLFAEPLAPLRVFGTLPGEHEVGSIDTGHDQDIYKFTLSQGGPVWIYATGLVDTVGTLYNGNFHEVAFNDDIGLAGLSTSFSIRETLEAGTYYIRVSSYGTGTGGYAVHAHLVVEPGNTIGTAATLELGVPLPGTIEPGNDADYFRFILGGDTHNHGTETYFLLDVITPGELGVEGEVLNSGGQNIDVNIYPHPDGFILAENFPAGTYYVKVTSHDGPAPYTIILLPHARYANLADECSAATGALTDPDTNARLFGDSYYACQWHLKNREPLQAGEDVNIEPAWASLIDGKALNGEGVHVVVVDNGMDHRHEDLAPNVDRSRNYDYSGEGDIHDPEYHHGTIVSGIIAARDNSMGVRGVAPRATIHGHNFLAAQSDFSQADSMTRNRETTAVSNNSWGPVDGPGLGPADTFWEAAVEKGIREGDQGRGTFYVFAAGNGGDDGDHANLDEFANFYAVTAACSVNGRGKKSNFSEFGPSLWVCAPGGDTRDGYRGLVSVDNSNRYRDRFHGTSGSAPIVSGVAALLRQVNPELTWRDIKLILAASARKNDPDDDGWEDGAFKYGSTLERYHFNHAYGFGVLDAKAAVDLVVHPTNPSQNWEVVPPLKSQTVKSSEGLSASIFLNRIATQTLPLATDIIFVEYVEVKAHFHHTSFRDLEIELVSPAGKTSKLLSHYELGNGIPLTGEIRLGSAKHLGENPNGAWTLRVTDRVNNDKSGALEGWGITVYGHRPTPSVPRAVSVTPGAETLTITWEQPELTRGAIGSYDLRYTRSGGGEPTLVENLRFGSNDLLSHNITGLVGGVEYNVEMRANNAAGEGPWSEAVKATPLRPTSNCANGEVLQGLAAQPIYQDLVRDCDALLEIAATLSGGGPLNWSTGLNFDDWDGVTSNLPFRRIPFRVTKLELGGKSLSGRIPHKLGELTGLETLDLSDNGLTGSIPVELGALTALTEMDLSENQLSGNVPTELGNLTALETLDLSNNNLSGGVPEVLGELDTGSPSQAKLHRLTMLRLNGNQLSETIPATLSNLSTLQELGLAGNNLNGSIPAELSKLASLQQLSLSGNQLTGEIPAALLVLSNLERVDLSDNRLTTETDGLPVPASVNLTLEFLDLSQNQLSGQIPDTLSNWRRLNELHLAENNLSGDIPATLNWGSFSQLALLDLSGNLFTGPIPPSVHTLESLGKLYLNDNEFAEDISSWGNALADLDELFIAQTAMTLTGCIPGSLRNVAKNDLPDLGLPYCDLLLTGLSFAGADLKAPSAFDPNTLSYLAVAGPSPVTIVPASQSGAGVGFQYRDVQDNVIGVNNAANPELDVHLGTGITTVKVVVVPLDTKAERVYQVRFQRAGIPDAPVFGPGGGVTEGDRSLGVAWTAPSNDGGYRIISYDLRYIETAATPRGDRYWTLMEKVWESDSGGLLEATVEQIISGEDYDVQVRAFNGSRHSSWSSSVRGMPTAVFCGSSVITDPANNLELVADCGALLAMRDTLAGTGPLNWSDADPISNWDGVMTGGTPERVTELNLGGKRLDGQIPSTIGRLTGVTTLDLSDNNLIGELPPQLGSLTALTTLELGDNPETLDRNLLTGEVPSWLGSLSRLVLLDLSGNAFGGTVPAELGNLHYLSHLNLSGNQLEGEIPSSFGGAGNWLDLDLSGNRLGGNVPALTVINTLDLSDNQLTGPVPTFGGSSGPTELLDLSNNQLTGSIPDAWGIQFTGSPPTIKLGGLKRLRLAGNQLTGQIPAGLGNMIALTELDLGGNMISGGIPSLTGLTALEKLYLNGNDLTGVVPAWLTNLTRLKEVDLGGNGLTGEIPSELGNLAMLTHLDLSDNGLTGQISGKLADSAHLEAVLLGGNRLAGGIPAELGNLASLKQLDLSANRLSGDIPVALGSARSLEELRLDGNSLTGEIPAQLGVLPRLVALHLGDNGLTGTIPTQMGSLTALEVLDLHHNALTGAIPAQLGNLDNLKELVLSENQLSGTVPTALGNLSNLEELWLGDNELTGTIPTDLGGLPNLEVLDLHHNGLTGSIPEDLGNLTELKVLLLALLDLGGEPPDLGALVNLERLHFWGNRLEGPIPAWIERLTNLSQLYLRDNQFSGAVPAWLAELPHLTVLHLADNDLTGCIPGELENLVHQITSDLEVLGLPFCPGTPLIGSVNRGIGTLTVHWSVPDDPDNLIDHFRVRHTRSDTPERVKTYPGNWTVEQVSPSDTSYNGPTSYTITGLIDGVQYDTQVNWATADNLEGPWSATRVGTPGTPLSDLGPAGARLVARYDVNANGKIEKSEVIAAIKDYLFGGVGITRADLIRLINFYLFG